MHKGVHHAERRSSWAWCALFCLKGRRIYEEKDWLAIGTVDFAGDSAAADAAGSVDGGAPYAGYFGVLGRDLDVRDGFLSCLSGHHHLPDGLPAGHGAEYDESR